jgi:tripartite motif-containing protein 71
MKKLLPQTKSVLVLVLTVFLMIASSKGSSAFEDVNFIQEIKTGFEEPVDVVLADDGTIYVLDSRLSKVLVYDEAGDYIKSFGTKGSGAGQMSRPKSIALSPSGELLIADTGNNRVQAFSREGKFLFSFGGYGSELGQFLSPSGVAVDYHGFILVADSRNKRVQVFSPKGIFRYQIPFMDQPTDVAVDRQNIYYVLRPEAGVVSAVETRKDMRTDISCMIGKKNYVSTGSGLTVDPWGNIYITETSEHSIKKFNRTEGLLLSFGSEGTSRGQFREPAGIFVDASNRIFAVDTRNKRMQILQNMAPMQPAMTRDTSLVPTIDYVETVPSDMYVSDLQFNDYGELLSLSDRSNSFIVHADEKKVVGATGRKKGQFTAPAAFDYGPDGKIYVADTRNHRVQVFDQDGKFEFAFGERGEKTGQLNSPQGIVVNSSGIIYVADTLNHRIQLYNKDGIFFMTFGVRSVNKKNQIPEGGTFFEPTALALDSMEQLYVLDSRNNRIQIFDEKGTFIYAIGKQGSQYRQMNEPADIALDEEDFIYIADAGNHRVQVIPPKDMPPVMPIVFGSEGEGYGNFQEITGIAVKDNRIFISDQLHKGIRVYQFDKNLQKQVPVELDVEPPIPNEEAQDDEAAFIL